MGFDIALVTHGDVIVPLNNQVGVGKTGIDVTLGHVEIDRQVGRRGGRGVHALGEHIVMQKRRIFPHGCMDVHDMGQHLVFDHHPLGRLGCQALRCGRDGRDGLAMKQDFFASHDDRGDVLEFHLDLGARKNPVTRIREVRGRHGRHDTGHGQCVREIDRSDDRVGVGAANNMAVNHARDVEVGTVFCPPGNLVQPIGPNRPRSHGLEFFLDIDRHRFMPPSFRHPRPALPG